MKGSPWAGSAPSPSRVETPEASSVDQLDVPWSVIVWNDPVNLATYVVWVFRKLFGFSEEEATKLMLDVHHRGRARIASGPREQAEVHATRLHQHGLWATLERP